jgi:hypothetical protein
MRNWALFVLLAVGYQIAYAELYEFSVSRASGNIYTVSGKDIIIQTRYCYEYAYSEDAVLKSRGYGGELLFTNSNHRCDVKAVFGAANQKVGKFKVTVSRDDDDWYEVFGSNNYIKTTMCIKLALGEEAVFVHKGSGIGTLFFDGGDTCMVEGVYSKMPI